MTSSQLLHFRLQILHNIRTTNKQDLCAVYRWVTNYHSSNAYNCIHLGTRPGVSIILHLNSTVVYSAINNTTKLIFFRNDKQLYFFKIFFCIVQMFLTCLFIVCIAFVTPFIACAMALLDRKVWIFKLTA